MRRFRENGHKRTRTVLIKDLTSVSNARHKSSFFIVCFFLCVSERNVQNLFVDSALTQIFLLMRSLLSYITQFQETCCYLTYPVWAWDCSFPFILGQPEGLYLGVNYTGGPCKAHDLLQQAELRTQHLILGFVSDYKLIYIIIRCIHGTYIKHTSLTIIHLYYTTFNSLLSKPCKFLRRTQIYCCESYRSKRESLFAQRLLLCSAYYLPMYQVMLLAAIRIQENPIGRINSLENRISLVADINSWTSKQTCRCCY